MKVIIKNSFVLILYFIVYVVLSTFIDPDSTYGGVGMGIMAVSFIMIIPIILLNAIVWLWSGSNHSSFIVYFLKFLVLGVAAMILMITADGRETKSDIKEIIGVACFYVLIPSIISAFVFKKSLIQRTDLL